MLPFLFTKAVWLQEHKLNSTHAAPYLEDPGFVAAHTCDSRAPWTMPSSNRGASRIECFHKICPPSAQIHHVSLQWGSKLQRAREEMILHSGNTLRREQNGFCIGLFNCVFWMIFSCCFVLFMSLCFEQDLTEIYSWVHNWRLVSVGSDNGLLISGNKPLRVPVLTINHDIMLHFLKTKMLWPIKVAF